MILSAEQKIMDSRKSNIPLNPLRAFSVAARHQTFTAAAREMGVTQVAISRQVATLENYLQVRLFDRDARSITLTPVGRTLSSRLIPLFGEIEDVTLEMLDAERASTVSLRSYPTFATYWLMPKLGSFRQKNTSIEIRLDTSVEPLDFLKTHLEVAIQLGDGNWPNARARELFPEELDAVCSPELAARYNGFSAPEQVRDAGLLHARYRRREWACWADANGIDIDTKSGHELDSSILTYSAAVNGMGVAMAQLALIENELASGSLIRPFKRPVKTGKSFWIVWPTTKSVKPMTKRLIDWILMAANEKPEFYKQERKPETGAVKLAGPV